MDTSGNLYVTGNTDSPDFPIVNQIPGACLGNCGTGESSDGFVTKINAAGSALIYSSYIGGSGVEFGTGIAVDSAGNAYVTGRTDSPDFPTREPDSGCLPGRLLGRSRRLRDQGCERRAHGAMTVAHSRPSVPARKTSADYGEICNRHFRKGVHHAIGAA